MTKNFDTLLESFLTELAPADISGFEGGMGGAVKQFSGTIPEGEPKGHLAPLQKLSKEDREVILKEIFKEVFSERENTYSPTTDSPEELHAAIQTAIQNVSGKTSLKASAKWTSKFLADRIMTSLKNNVKYTTAGGEETTQKDMTQKEFKQALTKALQEEPTETEESSEETEEESDVEKVYNKNPDVDYEPPAELQKAFDSIPADKEMSWEEVVKTIKMSPALALLDAGGLIETEKEAESSEDEEVKELEFDEKNEDESLGYEGKYEKMMRDLGGVSTTKDYNPKGWD